MPDYVTRRAFLRSLGFGSVALALSSCQQAAPPAAPAGSTPATQTIAAPEALNLPIVSQPLTLTYWAPMSTNVAASMKSFGEMGCYVELEKRTRIHLDFQHPPLQQEQDQFNLLVASGKYPDVVEFDWLHSYAGGPSKAIKDGVIVRLNDAIDRYAPNFKKLLADHPEWRKQIVTDEGDLYAFPFLRSEPILLTFIGPVIRSDWLTKLGLKTPTTLDDWHTMLKAFKDQNANARARHCPSARGSARSPAAGTPGMPRARSCATRLSVRGASRWASTRSITPSCTAPCSRSSKTSPRPCAPGSPRG